jgi:Glycosyltransferase family 87
LRRTNSKFVMDSRERLVRAITRLPVLLTLCYLAIFHTIVLLLNLGGRTWHHDFSVFYTSAIAIRRNLDPYTIDLVPLGRSLRMTIWPLIHTTDTPTALLLFMPFSRLAPETAHSIWIALNFVALIAALIILIRPKYSGLDLRMAILIAAIALLYAPVTENLIFSQRQFLILLLLVLMMRSLERGREATAGLLLAVAVAYRVFPVLIAGYFVMRRQWRPLIYLSIGLAIIGLVTVAGMGLPLCFNFLRGMQLAMTATSDPADVAIRGLIIRCFSYGFGDHLTSGMEIAQRVTIIIAQLTILALAIIPTVRSAHKSGFDLRTFCLWVAATVVLSPLSWIHYMVLMLIPFVAIASAAIRQQCSRRAVYAAIVSYILIAVTTHIRASLVSEVWWDGGVRYLAEGSSLALLIGFIATFWFANDPPGIAIPEVAADGVRALASTDPARAHVAPLHAALP